MGTFRGFTKLPWDNALGEAVSRGQLRPGCGPVSWGSFDLKLPLWHRQYLDSPPLAIQRSGSPWENPVFKLLLPQVSALQRETQMFCAKKMHDNRLRLTLDPKRLKSQGNKQLTGILIPKSRSFDDFILQSSQHGGKPLLRIRIARQVLSFTYYARKNLLKMQLHL